jgi:hypothetical protein
LAIGLIDLFFLPIEIRFSNKKVSSLKRWFSSMACSALKTNKPCSPTEFKMVRLAPTIIGRFLIVTIDATISLTMRLLGGKKKRKKKVYTKPKKIKHKHRKRSKALLEYFDVDNTGKITKLKIECEKCPAGNLYSLPQYMTI